MANLVVKTFITDGTFTPPAKVFNVTVVATLPITTFMPTTGTGLIDPFGSIWKWGKNTNGQIGNTAAAVTNQSSPIVVLGSTFIKAVTIDDSTNQGVIGITSNGAARGWGRNNNGQLGTGAITDVSSPVPVVGGLILSDLTPLGVATTGSSCFGLTPSGVAFAWGANQGGQLGDGTVVTKSSPVAVLGGFKFKKLVAAACSGAGTIVGLTSTGSAVAWGFNTNGQLGVASDVNPRSSPVAVLGGNTFQDIIINDSAVYGLTTSGAIIAWGANANGQLGDGTTVPKSSPVTVTGGLTFTKLFQDSKRTGNASMFALALDGTLKAWGANANGQLGRGNVTATSSPVTVLGGLSFQKIVYTNGSVIGLTTSGTLFAWGNNAAGQLGVGDVTPRSSPVSVTGVAGLTFVDIGAMGPAAATNPTMYAITNAGTTYAWGSNATGDVGDGTLVDKSSPTIVLGATTNQVSPTTVTTQVSVTPNTALSITFGVGQATIGTQIISTFKPSSIAIYYEQ